MFKLSCLAAIMIAAVSPAGDQKNKPATEELYFPDNRLTSGAEFLRCRPAHHVVLPR
jgi:hypothetical protein